MSQRNQEKPIINTLSAFSIIGKPLDGQVPVFDLASNTFVWGSAGGGGVSSEQFYQDKIIAGDAFEVSGNINVLNDIIFFEVPDGKTAFLIEAKIGMSTNPSIVPIGNGSPNTTDQVVADLKINGVTKSKAKIGGQAASFTSTGVGVGAGAGISAHTGSKFNVRMLSLVGDGIVRITIENVLDDGSAFAEMSGYVIDTV